MATNDKIKSLEEMVEELYNSRNATNIEVARVTTKLEILTGQNERLLSAIKENTEKFVNSASENNKRFVALIWKIVSVVVLMFAATLFAVIYGAVGERGLKSVRDTIPVIPTGSVGSFGPWTDPAAAADIARGPRWCDPTTI